MKVVFQLPRWTDRYSHCLIQFRRLLARHCWLRKPCAFRVARLWSTVTSALSGHHFYDVRLVLSLWLACALHMLESSENAASQCAHRKHAPNDVEGNVAVRRGRECHRKTACTPVRGQAVKQSAEMRSALDPPMFLPERHEVLTLVHPLTNLLANIALSSVHHYFLSVKRHEVCTLTPVRVCSPLSCCQAAQTFPSRASSKRGDVHLVSAALSEAQP